MKINLNEVELKALADWIHKQIPDLMKDGPPKINLVNINSYPANVIIELDFVLSEIQPELAVADSKTE